MSQEKLIHRLNRITGQLNGIKKKLESQEELDCLKTLQQLKASINALKKFGEAYMSLHLETCLQQNISSKDIKKNMSDVISAAFSL